MGVDTPAHCSFSPGTSLKKEVLRDDSTNELQVILATMDTTLIQVLWGNSPTSTRIGGRLPVRH